MSQSQKQQSTSPLPLKPKTPSPWPFIIKICGPFKWHVIGLMLVGVLWAIDMSLRPYVLKLIIDRASSVANTTFIDTIQTPVLIYLGLSLFSMLNLRFYDYIGLRFVPVFKSKIIQNLTYHVLGHSHSYFQTNFAGTLTNKINDVASGSKDVVYITIDRFFSNGIALLVATATFASVSPILACILFGWAVIFISFTYAITHRIHVLAFYMSEARSLLTGKIVDLFSNNLTVRLFARIKFEKAHLADQAKESIIREQKLRWLLLFMNSIQGLSFIMMIAGTFGYLVWAKKNGIVTVGDFALILTVTISIVEQLWGISKDFSEFVEESGRVSQGLTVTTIPHEIVDAPKANALHMKGGMIQFEGVQFWYKGAKPLFDHFNVTIETGQKVGLVGFSGSGKTTCVSLILRLYDIHQGRITIDHQDISKVTLDSLHSQIAFIPQEPSLLNRSIFENIRYGQPHATEAEVIEAAEKAHAHEFIMLLPEKYNSLVGERGARLSGGQRQRITIARAILKDAPILILDEATSALDTMTEGLIQQSLDELMEGRTTLVIAHRLSTLLNMDRIIVFDRGQIIEDGSHQSLLSSGGVYAKLWNSQVNGFLPNKKIR